MTLLTNEQKANPTIDDRNVVQDTLVACAKGVEPSSGQKSVIVGRVGGEARMGESKNCAALNPSSHWLGEERRSLSGLVGQK